MPRSGPIDGEIDGDIDIPDDFPHPTVDPDAAFRALDSSLPLLLLPLRLETRFRTVDTQPKLCIRIYPDTIHVDSHEPGLTTLERDDAMAYWRRALADDASKKEINAARDDLIAQHGVRRAAWIARVMRPTVPRDPTGPKQPTQQTQTPKRTAPPITDPNIPTKLDFPEPVLVETPGDPRAAALPGRFVAVGYRNGVVVLTQAGSTVPSDLRFGPTGDWAWVTDYEDAKSKGMAIEIDLSQHDDVASSGLDTLLVVGVSTADGDSDAATLDALLEAHRYTDGLAFVRQGTPTNNTDGSSAGWTKDEPDPAAFFSLDVDAEDLPSDDDANGIRFRNALGIPDAQLALRLDHAAEEENRQQRVMNRVLWPVTWGTYFDTLLSGTSTHVVSSAAQDFARLWFLDHVRGGAPLPTVRVGAQPYGILPVRRTVGRQVFKTDVEYLEETLLFLREMWRDSLDGVPRMDPTRGATGGDADKAVQEDLIAILGSLPHGAQFAVRALWDRRDLTLDFWDLAIQLLADPDGMYNGIGGSYVIASITGRLTSLDAQREAVEEMFDDVNGTVESDHREQCRDLLDFMLLMLDWYGERHAPLDDPALPGVEVTGVQARSVDDPILYYSSYSEDSRVFNNPLVQAEDAEPGALASDYLQELIDRLPAPTLAGRIEENPNIPPSIPEHFPPPLSDEFFLNKPLLYQLLDAAIPLLDDSQKDLFRTALTVLADLDVETLELRMRETLGLASNRLDAWITSLARERLDAMRVEKPSGIQLGAFGWLHDLRPDAKGTGESQGFVHAPSMTHAATAAVLRSGWSARGTEEADSPLAVDLRSDRVRVAAELLDGVRQGQTLGDLLGCQFERKLHDTFLDKYIDDIRRAVLGADGVTRDPIGPVDGLKLRALDAEGGVDAIVDGAPKAERERLRVALDSLEAAVDSVADATVTEAVHQLLGGNLARASATLEAISTGAAPPPELRSMRSQRTGVGITHRVFAVFGDASPDPTPWSSSPRAAFEPRLEAWIASVVGDPEKIVCAATPSSGGPAVAVSMAALGVSALDAVIETPLDPAEAEAEWSRRVSAYLLGSLPAEAADDTTVAVDMSAAGVLDAGNHEISFGDAALLCSALRALLANARPLEDRDLVMPGDEATAVADANELETRVRVLESTFKNGAQTLSDLVAEPNVDLVSLRSAMMALAGYALTDAVPALPPRESRRPELIAQAQRLSTRADEIVEAIDAAHGAWAEAPTTDASERLSRARTLVALMLGARFPVLPRFVPSGVVTLSEAFTRGTTLLNDDPAKTTGWLQQAARVRPDAARLDEAMCFADWMGERTATTIRIAQLPLVDGDPWVAIDAPTPNSGGRLALFAVDHDGVDAIASADRIAGLVIDEWVESIPAVDQTTGAAIHFDSPASRPPQSLLLVVPPEGETFSLDLVTETLTETLEAATLRAVGPEALAAYGHHLPAIYLPTEIQS